ncbi:MAG: FtsW/RodA/SpoVE family cell cycle protein [Microgenomates group bacterium]
MKNFFSKDATLFVSIALIVGTSLFVLKSVAPSLFPSYFIYIFLGILVFWFFSQIGFDVVSVFSNHLYVVSLVLLAITLIIGQVTRGTIRWIPIGSLSFQPAEIIRPFLLVFFAQYLTQGEITFNRLIRAGVLLLIPTILILVQPSLGVSILTVVGFLGVLLAGDFNKKYILAGVFGVILLIPIFWLIMQPYQRQRVLTFVNPQKDPLGSGYNSIQSQVAVGAGKLTGRGLGKGVQTQLAFLPEKQTDFIFAATSEELGFIGSSLLIILSFIILWRLTAFMENSTNPAARAYLSGFFLTYLAQVCVHIGMNLGLLPITGLPLPLVSAGGSSFLATMLGLGIALGAYKK